VKPGSAGPVGVFASAAPRPASRSACRLGGAIFDHIYWNHSVCRKFTGAMIRIRAGLQY